MPVNLLSRGLGQAIDPGGARVVLKEFAVSDATDGPVEVRIAGRPQGVVAFIMNQMKLSDDTVLTVRHERLRVETSSLSGKFARSIAVGDIASTHCGWSKSLLALALSILSALLTLVSLMFTAAGSEMASLAVIFLLATAASFALYWFSNKLTLSVETAGGQIIGIKFGSSVIGNQRVDFDTVGQVAQLLEDAAVMGQLPETVTRDDDADASSNQPRLNQPQTHGASR